MWVKRNFFSYWANIISLNIYGVLLFLLYIFCLFPSLFQLHMYMFKHSVFIHRFHVLFSFLCQCGEILLSCLQINCFLFSFQLSDKPIQISWFLYFKFSNSIGLHFLVSFFLLNFPICLHILHAFFTLSLRIDILSYFENKIPSLVILTYMRSFSLIL